MSSSEKASLHTPPLGSLPIVASSARLRSRRSELIANLGSIAIMAQIIP
ncbi:hypothetical protein APA_5321 [Pseudanabaena sp. lw0831]|nr:hypothetical protein APA_5321 [Pseudanabaena sp. lw0831]